MRSTTHELPDIRFLTSGPVTEDERAAAERALRTVLGDVRGTVSSAGLTLSVVADGALPRPALAQAVVEIGGRKVRAQAAARTITEAIGLLRERLTLRTSHLRDG
ncbi:hypothetical protein GCM10010191_22970 [Actinomadura vinacea]|uniref:YbaB/EbfC DNA-binding family protein n=1 Tax=Actinomadura vinacea TaxID=115336 RepID=A0ABN3IUA0_9ACTN